MPRSRRGTRSEPLEPGLDIAPPIAEMPTDSNPPRAGSHRPPAIQGGDRHRQVLGDLGNREQPLRSLDRGHQSATRLSVISNSDRCSTGTGPSAEDVARQPSSSRCRCRIESTSAPSRRARWLLTPELLAPRRLKRDGGETCRQRRRAATGPLRHPGARATCSCRRPGPRAMPPVTLIVSSSHVGAAAGAAAARMKRWDGYPGRGTGGHIANAPPSGSAPRAWPGAGRDGSWGGAPSNRDGARRRLPEPRWKLARPDSGGKHLTGAPARSLVHHPCVGSGCRPGDRPLGPPTNEPRRSGACARDPVSPG